MKKVHISEAEGKSSTIFETETVRCSICDGVSAQSVMRVSDSGYVVRKNYQRDSATPAEEVDDSITALEQGCSHMTLPRYKANTLRGKAFAGGDHLHCSKCFRTIPKSKSLSNIGAAESPIVSRYFRSEEEGKVVHKKTTETTIKYKNVNFRESDSLISYCETNEKETINDQPENLNVIHRPITCPVTECRKMIARTSVLQHFFFDHSKIPRITLLVSELKRVFINTSAITKKIRCFAVFLIQNDALLVHTTDSDALVNGGYKNSSFLLMGVRMQSAETIKKRAEYVSIRHVQTQTESLKAISNKDVNADERYIVHQHDAIILWMCKLGDVIFYYNISIRSPDNKVGFSFTGKPLNIGDFLGLQDIYDQVECLRIMEKASYKLINEQNELEVTVNIFN